MRLLLGIVLAAGCSKDVTKDIEGLADRACACADKKDTACGKGVLADLVKLTEATNVKGDERKSAEAAKRLGECLERSGVSGLEISEAISQTKKPEPGSAAPPAPPAPPPSEQPPAGSGSAP